MRTKAKLRQAATDHMTILEQTPERVKKYFGDPIVSFPALKIRLCCDTVSSSNTGPTSTAPNHGKARPAFSCTSAQGRWPCSHGVPRPVSQRHINHASALSPASLNYRPWGWSQSLNFGPRAGLLDEAKCKLERTFGTTSRKVSLIG